MVFKPLQRTMMYLNFYKMDEDLKIYVITAQKPFFLKSFFMRKKSDEEKLFDKEISRLLKARRDEKKLTQEIVSERSGVTRITIGKWERGEKTPQSFDLYNVIKILYKNPAEFWESLASNYEKRVSPIQAAAEKDKYLKYVEQTRKKRNGMG